MKKLNILITGAGAPGIMGTLYSLKNNYDNREIKVIGTDIKNEVVGKYLCDSFYVIPKASLTQEYLDSLEKICKKEHIDIIIPQNTGELITLASNVDKFKQIGTSILISNSDSINIANNKFELMKICDELNIPVTKFKLVNNFKDLFEFAEKLDWPQAKIVVKPPVSNGLRGVRIIDENINLKELFYNEKPTNLYIRMKDLKNILGDKFPELVVMEYLPGKEYTVDVLRTIDTTVIVPRVRDLIRTGITFNGTTEFNEKIIDYSIKISKKINLTYCFGFQFKLDENGIPKILESNPRVQGTMILATFAGFNIIYSAVKSLLGEKIPNFDIKWGTKIFRYWGGISVKNNKLIERI